jgi:hypothetical protein
MIVVFIYVYWWQRSSVIVGIIYYIRGLGIRVMVFYDNMSIISWWSVLLVKETGVPRENQQPSTSHSQTLSHRVVSSTPYHEWDSSSALQWISTF